MKSPFISIIIPTFNSAKTLAIALESVLQQNYEHKEIIVIDGNSTDETINLVSNYAKLYSYIFWISEKDNGIYDAMNKGIKLAKGDWLYFLGSDDKLFSNDVLSRVFVPENYQNIHFLYGDIQWQISKNRYAGEINIDKIVRVNMSHQAIFYHHSIFKKYPTYNINYKVCADWYLNMLCYLDESINIKYIDIIITEFYEYGFGSQNEDITFRYAADKLIYEQFIHKVSPACKYQLYEDLIVSGIDKIANHKNTLQGIKDVLKGGAANQHLLKSIKDIFYWLWKR